MKNIINYWAKLTNESFNPDDDKNDLNDFKAEEYEKNKDLEEMYNKLQLKAKEVKKAIQDNKNVKEAEDDDNEEEALDQETKNIMAQVDKTVNDYKDTMKRNQEKIDGTYDGDIKKDVKEQNKKYYVYKRAQIYKPGNSKSDVENTHSLETYATWEKGSYEMNVSEIKEFYTENEAKAYCSKEMREFGKKTGAKLEDFKLISYNEEITNTYKQTKDSEKKQETVNVNGLPEAVVKTDPQAIGFLYTKTDGEGQQWAKGPHSDGNYTYEKINKTIFAEFIIYKAEQPVPFSGGWGELYNAFMEANYPGWKEEQEQKALERQQYQDSLKGLASLQKELSQLRKEKGINKGSADKNYADNYAKTAKDDIPLATDDEIANAASKDGYQSQEDREREEEEYNQRHGGKFGDAGRYGYTDGGYDRDDDDYENAQQSFEEGETIETVPTDGEDTENPKQKKEDEDEEDK